MKRKYWILTGVLIVIAVLIIINLKANRGKSIDVQVEKVQRRNLKMIITASGSIRPKRKIDVSASTIGKITSVSVKEGDYVEKGQFLMQIDPEQLESSVMRIEASLQSARAASKEARFRMKQRKNELDRVKRLFEKGFRTEEDVETAQTAYNVAVASLDASIQRVAEQKALLKSAKHDLKEVTINSGMSGVVTRLNVEEGETAIMGTINNPGTVLMTIADLSKIEAEVEIDETEVVYIKVGDEAGVTLDAFPDTTYRGEVTEIGNSPVLSSSVSGQQGVDFKVVITLHDTIQNVRPGLSADAEIVVAERDSALSIPIQSLTVRESNEINDYEVSDTLSAERKEIEGVFVISEGKAKFRRIEVGISGNKYFEVVSGLAEGEQVVSGNYKAIRDLEDDGRVEIKGK